MVAKTGAARLALATGAPVIPVAHWGAQEILPYGSEKPQLSPARRCRWWPGRRWTCPPTQDQRLGAATVLRAATADIMARHHRLLAKISAARRRRRTVGSRPGGRGLGRS